MSRTVTVGISDLNVVKAPDVLVTYALGSCVGICLYDPISKVAGLSHIMLPTSNAMPPTDLRTAYKFADTAIPLLIKKMEENGARRIRMKAKIAGGAQMFGATTSAAINNIGQRNTQAVKAALMSLRIPIIAEDCGKNYGRTQFFYSEDGTMRIKSATKGEWTF